MKATKARAIRLVMPVILLLSMTACGQPNSTLPVGEETSSEPTLAAPTEPSQPTSTTADTGEDTPVPVATQPPHTAAEPETTPEGAPEPPPTESMESVGAIPVNVNTAFILDASGSMLAGLDGGTRLVVAQDAIAALSAGLPSELNASLWVYGHRIEQDDKAASCQDIEQVIPLGSVDAARFSTVAHSFGAKGYTPITEAIRQAAGSLPRGENERNTVVLVSDGEETCGGDPCALAAELAAGDIELVIHTIGLAVDEATRAQLQCIADVTGGSYRDADSAEELDLALVEAADAAAEVTGGDVDDEVAAAFGLGLREGLLDSAHG